jgi:hypothetical protein
MTHRTIASLAAATLAATLGCRGATPSPASGGGESSTTTSGSESAETTESTSTSASSESTSGSESSGRPERDPDYSLCEEPEAIVDVIRGTTPGGEMTVEEGWVGVFVCSGVPFFELSLLPLSDRGFPSYLFVAPIDTHLLDLPLMGSYPAEDPYHPDATATITFPEPVPLLGGEVDPWKHVRANIVLQGAEWDFEVDVDFIHCGVYACDCPCE